MWKSRWTCREGYADIIIVKTSIQLSSTYESVTIVYADLLKLFTGWRNVTNKLSFANQKKDAGALGKNESLFKSVKLFTRKNIDANMIAQTEERFFIALYSGYKRKESINIKMLRKIGEKHKKKPRSSNSSPRYITFLYSFRNYYQV